ncbi:MAG: CcmD family protein [Spirochaetes bacterium]|nr:CcmD family protein [Spirochaetota bacterium]
MRRIFGTLLIAAAIFGTGVWTTFGLAADVGGGERTVAAAAHTQPERTQEIDPGDADEPIYRVLGIVLFVWIGISLYLFFIDRKITRLEKRIK